MPVDIKRLEELEERGRELLDPASDDYDDMVNDLNDIGNLIDEHYRSQRKVDDSGRLKAEAPSRYGSSVEATDPSKSPEYFFEPNVTEVQRFLRSNPQAVDRLGMRRLIEGIAVPEGREPVADPMTGAVQGWNVTPAQTHLDVLTEESPEYKPIADEMWRLRQEEAKRTGSGVKRYRDIKLKRGEIGDYIHGGVTKGMQRVVAPALMGIANVAAVGQGAAIGDAITDLADYELGKRGINLEDYFGPQPRSEEVTARNPFATNVGEFAAYALPGNPTNFVQNALVEMAAGPVKNVVSRGVANAGNYTARKLPGRAFSSAISGGVTNSIEALGRETTEQVLQHPEQDFTRSFMTAAQNVPQNMATGAIAGGGLDLAAQGANKAREVFSGYARNAPLVTVENAGGEASIPFGVRPPDEIRAARDRARLDRFDPTKAPSTAEGNLSADLAPTLDESVRRRAVEEQERIGSQMEQYYAHPDYRDIEGSVKPALQSLIDSVSGTFGRSVKRSSVPVNPQKLQRIGEILRQYAPDPDVVSDAIAPALAHEHGGIVLSPDVANSMLGNHIDPVRPGQSVVIYPISVNARALTELEQRIYDELDAAAGKGLKDDPVWRRVNEGIKETRDQFPWYEDEAGNLVGIPPESARQEPFSVDPGAGPQTEDMRVLAPPTVVGGGPQRKPEGLMGVGPGRPDLPSNPFDPLAPKRPSTGGVDVLPQPIGVGGEDMVARPEGLFGVGPGEPPIPENPFDQRLPVAREVVRPMTQLEVTGGEYGPPPSLDPNARMGVGDRFNPEPVQGFSRETPPGGISAQPTVGVKGDYNKPPEIEPAPITERGVGQFRIMVVEDGKPRPVAGMRVANSAKEAAEMVDTLNSYGTDTFVAEPIGAAPSPVREPAARSDELAASNFDEKLYQREYGPTVQTSPDERGGLERALDDQLEQAPKVPTEEIEADAALQTADREQVAAAQKEYVENLFAPGREARAAQVEKIRELGEHPEVIEEAIAQVKDIDAKFGPIDQEQKRAMIVSAIEQRLGRKIDVEDLIRFGLISSGAVAMSSDDGGEGVGAGIGTFLTSLGLRGKAKKGEPEGPQVTKPRKPTQPTAMLDDGREVKGFSAKRSQQHDRQTAIEKAMKRLGVEGDATLEGRIRTYGQNPDRQKIDQALLDEAIAAGRADDLRKAAGANAYAELKDRASPFGSLKGLGNALIDMIGFRTYAALEYPAGRFNREHVRNPYVREPTTLAGEMQRAMLEDPARRLLDLSRGAPAARWTDDVMRLYRGDTRYEENKEEKKKDRHP